jgi:hypothetical protein
MPSVSQQKHMTGLEWSILTDSYDKGDPEWIMKPI